MAGVGDLGDLLGGLFGRGGGRRVRPRSPARAAAPTSSPTYASGFREAIEGVTVPLAPHDRRRLRDLSRQRGQAGHVASHLPDLPRQRAGLA